MMKQKLSIVILIILIVILLFIIYQKYIEKKILINVFGYSHLVVLSGSMSPSIKEKEGIIIKKEKEYLVDDIITFNVDNEYLITHRIVEIKEKNGEKIYITKGDFNNFNDPYEIFFKDIEGKVVFHSRILNFRLN